MKKGFSLVELLAVIVILAIVAALASTAILDLIGSSKDSAALQSASSYIRTVKDLIISNQTRYKTLITQGASAIEIDEAKSKLIEDTYYDFSLGLQNVYSVSELKGKGVVVDGIAPTDGYVVIFQNNVLDYVVEIDDKIIEYDAENGGASISDLPSVSAAKEDLTLPAIVYIEKKYATNLEDDGTRDHNYRFNKEIQITIDGDSATYSIVGIFNNVEDQYGIKSTRMKVVRNTASSSYDEFESIFNSLNLKNKKFSAKYHIGEYNQTTDFNTLYTEERYIPYEDVSGNVHYTTKAATVTKNYFVINASDCLYARWLGNKGRLYSSYDTTTLSHRTYCNSGIVENSTSSYYMALYLPEDIIFSSQTENKIVEFK